MRKTLITLILIFSSFTSYCQHPYVQKLKSVAEITFPDTPKAVSTEADTVYIYRNIENSIYMAQCSPAEKNIGDLLNPHILDTLYNNYIGGAVGSVKGKIFYKKTFTEQGLNGIEFDYKANLKGIPYYAYHRAFYFNNFLVGYGYFSKDSLQRNDKKIGSFFNTFKLKIKPGDIRQKNASDLGYIAGGIFAIVSIFGIIALVIFLIVFIVKKLSNKKNA